MSIAPVSAAIARPPLRSSAALDANQPVLDVRLGGPANLTRYEAVTGGAGYLLRRNFRVYAEGTWDRGLHEAQWTVGLTTAF